VSERARRGLGEGSRKTGIDTSEPTLEDEPDMRRRVGTEAFGQMAPGVDELAPCEVAAVSATRLRLQVQAVGGEL